MALLIPMGCANMAGAEMISSLISISTVLLSLTSLMALQEAAEAHGCSGSERLGEV